MPVVYESIPKTTIKDDYNSYYSNGELIPPSCVNSALIGNMYKSIDSIKFPQGVENCSGMFKTQCKLNTDITIPDSVIDCSEMFAVGFGLNFNNITINIGNNVKNCHAMFYNANYNKPMTLPNSVEDCSRMFCGSSFNQPITLSDNLKNCSKMFFMGGYWASNYFNQPITISGNVNDCSNMFEPSRYNQPVTLSTGVENTSNLFYNCQLFNQPINIPDTVTDCSNMFFNAGNLNQKVNLGNNIIDCSDMFHCNIRNDYGVLIQNWSYFNQSVTIPDSVINCVNMFANCVNLNKSIYIGNNVENAYHMFYNCNNFNGYISIDENLRLVNCSGMFENCTNFNTITPIDLNNVDDASRMFLGCTSLRKTISVSNCNNCIDMFVSIGNSHPDIYVSNVNYFNGITLGSAGIYHIDNINSSSCEEVDFNGSIFISNVNSFQFKSCNLRNVAISIRNVQNCASAFLGSGTDGGITHSIFRLDVSNVDNASMMFAKYPSFSSYLSYDFSLSVRNINDASAMFASSIPSRPSRFDQINLRLENINNASQMFGDCFNLKSVPSMKNIINCSGMFFNCITLSGDLGSDAFVPTNAIDCSYMYGNTRAFGNTSQITIPDSVVNCASMFERSSINGNVVIGNNVENCSKMFANATNFNCNLTIPDSVVNCASMFAGSTNFESHIFFETLSGFIDGDLTLFDTAKLKNKRVTLHFNSILNSSFNRTDSQSLIGATIRWTNMSDNNGFYNSTYNIYCYNNYIPS